MRYDVGLKGTPMARWVLMLVVVVGNGVWCAGEVEAEEKGRDWVAVVRGLDSDWNPSKLRRLRSELTAVLDVRRLSLLERDAAAARWLAEGEQLSPVWEPEWGRPRYSWDANGPAHDEGDTVLEDLVQYGLTPRAARLIKGWSPEEHRIFANRMLDRVMHGETGLIRAMRMVSVKPIEIGAKLIPILRSGTAASRRTAAQVAAAVGYDVEGLEAALWAIVRSLDVQGSRDAAAALDTEEAKQLARLSELFEDLRAMSKNRRIVAAKQLDELGVYPKAITGALVKAAEEGNLVVREGIVAGLEEAFVSGREVKVTLDELARRGDVRGVYARAALAAVRE